MEKPLPWVIWQAWNMMRRVNAQYGADGLGYTQEYFEEVISDCEKAYQQLTGQEVTPWHPQYNKIEIKRSKAMTTETAAGSLDEQMRLAFVAGAKWWEWKKTGATMWQSDQDAAYEAARSLKIVEMKDGK